MSEPTCPIGAGDVVPAHDQPPLHLGAGYQHPAGAGRLGASNYPCAVPGINLNDYSLNAQQKGWGGPCVGPFTTVSLSSGAKVTVDSRIAALVKLIMEANIAEGYSYRAADTGAYNCRYIAGTTVWSNHAWGLAIDSNWNTNPQHSPLTTDRPAWEIQRWARYGFAWGGFYTSPTVPDAMHTEFMGTPAQAASALSLAQSELGGGGGGGTAPALLPAWALPAGDYYGPTSDTSPHRHDGSLAADTATVKGLQEWLTYRGYPLTADGSYGALTAAAVSNWQHANYPGTLYWGDVYPGDYYALEGQTPPPPSTGGQLPAAERSPITGNMEVPGFDASYTKPPASAMAGAGYRFVIGYVSPTSGKNLSAGDVSAYRGAGIAVGLVWESTAGRALTGGSAGGAADGAAANAQANALGYPSTAPIFFAVDQDTTSANYAAIAAYASGFNSATSRPVGIYGEADVIDHFVTPGVQPVQYGWQTAAWSGGRLSSKAHLYQRVGHPGWPVPSGVSSTSFDEDVALAYLPLMGW